MAFKVGSIIFRNQLLVLLVFLCLAPRSKVYGSDMPEDLVSLFMSSQDLLRSEDLPKFRDWYKKIRMGQYPTLEASNIEHDAELLVLYASPIFTSQDGVRIVEACYGDLTRHQQRLRLSDFIHQRVSVEFDELTKNIEEPLATHVLIKKLRRIEHLLRIVRIYKEFGEQSSEILVTALYRWSLPADLLMMNSEETTHFKITKLDLIKIFYPGNIWKSSFLGSYTDLKVFSSPIRYRDGSLEIYLNPSMEEVCQRKTPLRIELIVSFSYEKRDNDQKIISVQESRKLALTGMNIFDFSFTSQMDSFLLNAITSQHNSIQKNLQEKTSLGFTKLFQSYQHWIKLQDFAQYCLSQQSSACLILRTIEKEFLVTWNVDNLKKRIERDALLLRDEFKNEVLSNHASDLLQMISDEDPIELILLEYDAMVEEAERVEISSKK